VRVRATDEGELLMRQAAEARFDIIVDALEALTAADRTALVQAAPALTRLAGEMSAQRTR